MLCTLHPVCRGTDFYRPSATTKSRKGKRDGTPGQTDRETGKRPVFRPRRGRHASGHEIREAGKRATGQTGTKKHTTANTATTRRDASGQRTRHEQESDAEKLQNHGIQSAGVGRRKLKSRPPESGKSRHGYETRHTGRTGIRAFLLTKMDLPDRQLPHL